MAEPEFIKQQKDLLHEYFLKTKDDASWGQMVQLASVAGSLQDPSHVPWKNMVNLFLKLKEWYQPPGNIWKLQTFYLYVVLHPFAKTHTTFVHDPDFLEGLKEITAYRQRMTTSG